MFDVTSYSFTSFGGVPSLNIFRKSADDVSLIGMRETPFISAKKIQEFH